MSLGPDRARRPLAFTPLPGLLVAVILLSTGAEVAFADPSNTSLPAVPSSVQGGGAFVDCPSAPATNCTLASTGTTWTIGPTSSWCVPTSSATENGWNGSFTSTVWHCAATALIFTINASRPSTLAGSLLVYGPFQVWLISAADACGLFAELARFGISCPQPAGYVPPFSWNESEPTAATVGLSTLPFDLNGSYEVLPPNVVWSVWIVDVGLLPEAVTALTDISAAPTASLPTES
ncbi:MAG: hypothetical protein L3J96_02805 [Thermoplasmata archaeon]|nr:hypothetical protein [Thermoplasmata archaeon]